MKKSNLLEDVYTYNDFLHDGKAKGCEPKKKVTSNIEKAYLISEYNGHMYPTKSFDSEEHRLENALRHANVWIVLKEKAISPEVLDGVCLITIPIKILAVETEFAITELWTCSVILSCGKYICKSGKKRKCAYRKFDHGYWGASGQQSGKCLYYYQCRQRTYV
jgi:hypothetical protein